MNNKPTPKFKIEFELTSMDIIAIILASVALWAAFKFLF